jgi:hypothetical protein
VLTAADVHAPALRCELNTLQARTAAERHAIENAVVPPVHAEDLAGIQHPQLARTCAKGQPVHTALEYCLGTGGRDRLPGGHHPRIGDRANRSLRRLCGSEGGHIEVKNDILAQRKELAQGLLQNCQTWARVLLSTFDTAVERWKRDGPMAAEREIMAIGDIFIPPSIGSGVHYRNLISTKPSFSIQNGKMITTNIALYPVKRHPSSCKNLIRADFYHAALTSKHAPSLQRIVQRPLFEM